MASIDEHEALKKEKKDAETKRRMHGDYFRDEMKWRFRRP